MLCFFLGMDMALSVRSHTTSRHVVHNSPPAHTTRGHHVRLDSDDNLVWIRRLLTTKTKTKDTWHNWNFSSTQNYWSYSSFFSSELIHENVARCSNQNPRCTTILNQNFPFCHVGDSSTRAIIVDCNDGEWNINKRNERETELINV